jgi:hypothetical protein
MEEKRNVNWLMGDSLKKEQFSKFLKRYGGAGNKKNKKRSHPFFPSQHADEGLSFIETVDLLAQSEAENDFQKGVEDLVANFLSNESEQEVFLPLELKNKLLSASQETKDR